MLHKPLMALAVALTASAAIPGPAQAVDPCRQAYEHLRDAEAKLDHWIAAHCPNNGACTGSAARFHRLYQNYLNAKSAVSSACP